MRSNVPQATGSERTCCSYYREAIGSFTASYERFNELFLRIVLKAAGCSDRAVAEAWGAVSKMSERQLGAFVFMHLREFGTPPALLESGMTSLRNKVAHQGYFPERHECVKYGDAVAAFIRENIRRLHSSDKHREELIRCVNDQGDFSPTGPRVHFQPYSPFATNRELVDDEKSVAELLDQVVAVRNLPKTP